MITSRILHVIGGSFSFISVATSLDFIVVRQLDNFTSSFRSKLEAVNNVFVIINHLHDKISMVYAIIVQILLYLLHVPNYYGLIF
jgi:hypothetical protein